MSSIPEALQKKLTSWKSKGELCPARIVGLEKQKDAEVYVQRWNRSQRRWRAFRSFLTFFGLTFLSACIPIVHFFLVPVFFLSALIVPIFVYKKQSVVLGGVGVCPFCQATFEVAGASDSWPLQDVCTACRQHVRVERGSGKLEKLL